MPASSPPPVPVTAPPDEVLREVLDRIDDGERVALATVVRRRGSTPSTPGQKLALFAGGAVGTVGGGAVEQRVMGVMVEALAAPRPEARIETYELGPALGMCCGGAVDVLVEVLDPAVCVLVVGAGHVGKATAPLLASLGFRVTLCDGRDQIARDEARSGSGPVASSPRLGFVHADHDDPGVLEALGSEPQRAAALVMTHDHQLDHTVIEWALGEGFAFVGGVGSRAKAKRTAQRLTAIELAPADVERVHMPLGVDIGARTPDEIAVSIAGELIAWRAGLLDR